MFPKIFGKIGVMALNPLAAPLTEIRSTSIVAILFPVALYSDYPEERVGSKGAESGQTFIFDPEA